MYMYIHTYIYIYIYVLHNCISALNKYVLQQLYVQLNHPMCKTTSSVDALRF